MAALTRLEASQPWPEFQDFGILAHVHNHVHILALNVAGSRPRTNPAKIEVVWMETCRDDESVRLFVFAM